MNKKILVISIICCVLLSLNKNIKENFEFKNDFKYSKQILSISSSFNFILFFFALHTLNFLENSKQTHLFNIYSTLLLIPTGISQLLCLLFSLHLLRKHNIFKFQNTSKKVVIIMFLFLLTAYVIINLSLYFFGNLTMKDIKFQKIYSNPTIKIHDLVKMNIIKKHHSKLISQKAKIGKNFIKDKKIVIGLLTKNSEYHIPNMKIKLELIGSMFQKYKIVLFENDSTDNTRYHLKKWEKNNSNVHLIKCENNPECKFNWKDAKLSGLLSTERMDKMRYMRNIVFDHVKKNFSDWDYYMVMDFDLCGSLFIDGLLSSFSYNSWDAMFSNGLTSYPFFSKFIIYDSFAYQSFDEKINNETNVIRKNLLMNEELENAQKNMNIQKCKSGFNGLIIYKMNSILNCSYDKNTKQDFKCEHIDLHQNMIDNNNTNIFYNPKMILFVGQQGLHRSKFLNSSIW